MIKLYILKGYIIQYLYTFLIIVCFLTGCSFKQTPKTSQAVFMTIKTPTIKYSDSGFIRQYDNFTNIQLFNSGVLVLDIDINEKICLNSVCYNKLQFNSQFLGNMYYNNFLEDIVLFRPIYNKKALQYNEQGFTQSLHVKKREIFYEVKTKNVIFKDKTNKVLIKIQELRK